jgi:hypothetical protein
MKQTLAKFFSNCEDLLRREQNPADYPRDARYEELFQDALKGIKKNPEFYAHIFAGDAEDRIIRDGEFGQAERPKGSISCNINSVGNESERQLGAERLIELGKSYRPPPTGRCPEKDGPDLEPN